MLGAQRLELGHEPEVPAERELGLDPLLDGAEPQLLEPLDVEARERLELEIGERASLPEPLGGAEALAAAAASPPPRASRPSATSCSNCSRSSSPGSTRRR